MSERTERLEAAAARFDATAGMAEARGRLAAEQHWYTEAGVDEQRAAENRAVAELLRAIAVRLRSPIDERFQPNYVAPALAVADAVLGAS